MHRGRLPATAHLALLRQRRPRQRLQVQALRSAPWRRTRARRACDPAAGQPTSAVLAGTWGLRASAKGGCEYELARLDRRSRARGRQLQARGCWSRIRGAAALGARWPRYALAALPPPPRARLTWASRWRSQAAARRWLAARPASALQQARRPARREVGAAAAQRGTPPAASRRLAAAGAPCSAPCRGCAATRGRGAVAAPLGMPADALHYSARTTPGSAPPPSAQRPARRAAAAPVQRRRHLVGAGRPGARSTRPRCPIAATRQAPADVPATRCRHLLDWRRHGGAAGLRHGRRQQVVLAFGGGRRLRERYARAGRAVAARPRSRRRARPLAGGPARKLIPWYRY